MRPPCSLTSSALVECLGFSVRKQRLDPAFRQTHLKISARPSHSGSKTFSRGLSCGISRVIAPLIMNSPRNCPTPLSTLAYFLIRSPALCRLRWSNSHFHYQFDQFNIQPAWGLSSGDAAVCVQHKMCGVLHAISIGPNSTPPLLTSALLSSH